MYINIYIYIYIYTCMCVYHLTLLLFISSFPRILLRLFFLYIHVCCSLVVFLYQVSSAHFPAHTCPISNIHLCIYIHVCACASQMSPLCIIFLPAHFAESPRISPKLPATFIFVCCREFRGKACAMFKRVKCWFLLQ